MASLKSVKSKTKAFPAPCDGRGIVHTDKVVLGAASGGGVGTPSTSDTIDFFVAAGTEVGELSFVGDDCDTGTTFQAKIGYRPVSSADGSLAASDAYFAAAGSFMQAAGRVECTFKPITFQQDVFITITPTANPTGISGNPEIHMVLTGMSHGPK